MKNKRHWSDISDNMTILIALGIMLAFITIAEILNK